MKQMIDVLLSIEEEQPIDLEVELSSGGKPYTGQYTVIPKVVEQTLKTENLSMLDDVSVKSIPTHEVSNEFGTTMIIGGIL